MALCFTYAAIYYIMFINHYGADHDIIYTSGVFEDYQELIKRISFELMDLDEIINYYVGCFFYKIISLLQSF